MRLALVVVALLFSPHFVHLESGSGHPAGPIITPLSDSREKGSQVNFTCCLEGHTDAFVWWIGEDLAGHYSKTHNVNITEELSGSCSQMTFIASPFYGKCEVLIKCLSTRTAEAHLSIEGLFPAPRIVNQYNETYVTLSWNTAEFTDVNYTVCIDSQEDCINTSESSYSLKRPDKEDKSITVSVRAINETCKGKITEKNLTLDSINPPTTLQGLSNGGIYGLSFACVFVAVAVAVVGVLIIVCCCKPKKCSKKTEKTKKGFHVNGPTKDTTYHKRFPEDVESDSPNKKGPRQRKSVHH